jgi:hypothetical protein
MRILGVTASGADVSDYELIETQILGSAQASVVFDVSSFASTYKHLQIRWTARTTVNQSGSGETLRIRFNGVSSSTYRGHGLYGQSGVAQSFSYADTSLGISRAADSPSATGVFGAGVTDILDAYSTTKNTTIRNFGGQVSNITGNANIYLDSGVFLNTDAIDSIFIAPFTASNIIAGSRFSIYGVK